MDRIEVQIHKDDLCPICKEKLLILNEKNEIQKPINMKSDLLPGNGIAHDACFMPFLNEEKIKVLVKIRCYSIGDTISISPIIREIKRIYPKCFVGVLTFYPDLFIYNPLVDEILDLNRIVYDDMIKPYTFHIDSFNSEKGGHFAMHGVDFAAICSFGRQLVREACEYEINFSNLEMDSMIKTVSDLGMKLNDEKYIVVHPHGTEWKTRDWGKVHFVELVKRLKKEYPDHKIVSIGGKRSEVPSQKMDNYVDTECDYNLFGKLSILESIAFLNHPSIDLFISPDTGALHIAACARELSIVGIFTLVRAEFRTPIRNKVFGYKFRGVNADDPCCCTYNARFMTDEAHFQVCPKVTFLNKVKSIDVPTKFKRVGLKNYDASKEWQEHMVEKDIDEELKKFEPLKCFPTVDKVMEAIDSLMLGK